MKTSERDFSDGAYRPNVAYETVCFSLIIRGLEQTAGRQASP
jgi:hypothetical protein